MVYAQGKHSVYDIVQYRPNKHQLKKGNTFSIHFYNAGAPTFGVLSKLPRPQTPLMDSSIAKAESKRTILTTCIFTSVREYVFYVFFLQISKKT